ncbi:helix-turn-helix domain-containing protein [Streptomyces sp. HNM0663]|uniref:Helix-turn-helix domain-containing protein n=1 Tax=Streptomyces chengmaiensis TaxID=3040919 RepID=A0ABT6HL02_9ACTN|nr:helix-turn-helix domain-containing protein [Streptomyces chengmaiensis]MDH2389414.1 helix-turn-helix domain-containing protein [Streptomyces chengmaiensis]
MSIEAMAWAFKQKIPNPGAKLVLLALCDFADESWSCFPGQETLSTKTSQSLSTVRRHLKWLEQQGYMSRSPRFVEGRRTSNRYVLRTPRPVGPPPHPQDPGGPGDAAEQADDEDVNQEPAPEDTGAKQAVKMTAGHNDLRSNSTGVPVKMTGEPSENHQRNNPLPPAEGDGRGGAGGTGEAGAENGGGSSGGCTAHPSAPAANCRGCGTNPRSRQAAAAAQEKQAKAARARDRDRRWFQEDGARRAQVQALEAQGVLEGPRKAAREALQRGRQRDGIPLTSRKEYLTQSDQE